MGILSFIGFIAVIAYVVKFHDKRKERTKMRIIEEWKREHPDVILQNGCDYREVN